MSWLSNLKNNLFKAGWVMVDENNKKIIDNNELANKKIEAFHEEEAKRMMAERQEGGEDVFFDGFSEGIGYDQIDSFDENQNIIGADGPDGFSQGEFNGMGDDSFANLQDAMGDPGFMDSPGFASEDMDMGEQAPEQVIEESPQINLEEIQAQIDEQLRMADEQAQQIIADANAKADEIMSHAEEMRNQAIEEGRQSGYNEGFQQGEAEAEQLKADAASEIEAEKEKLQSDFQQLVNSIEPDMVDALTGIYEHVFHVEFKENKDIILHLIKNTLGKMDSGIDIIIHISSDDYDLVTDEKSALEESMASPNSNLEIIEDPLLKENECIIESEGGVFDCSLGVELSELARKLKLLSYDRNKR